MRKSKSMIALLAAGSMLLAMLQPVSFAADNTSIVIPGKSASAVEYVYDGQTYRNDNTYVMWSNDATVSAENMHIASRVKTSNPEDVWADVTKFPEGITMEYKVNVAEAGVYQLDITGTDVTFVYRSPYAVAMDNKDFKSIDVLTATEVNRIDVPNMSFDSTGLMVEYKTPLKYDLTAGEHTLRVNITGKAPNTGKLQYDAYIDTIKLNKTNDTEAKDIYVHGMDRYTNATEGLSVIHDTNAPKDGGVHTGAARQLRTPNKVFADGGYYISYPFEVQTAGAYRITDLGISSQESTTGWLSKVAVAIDDMPYTKIQSVTKKSTSYRDTATFGDKFTTLFEKADHLRAVQINEDKTQRYWLSEGTHYLNLWIYEKRNPQGEANAMVWFDHVKMTRETNADGSIAIYGTDYSKNNFASLPEAWQGVTKQLMLLGQETGSLPYITDHPEYNNKVMSVVASATEEAFPADGIVVEYPFYCTEAGWYRMDVIKNNNGTWFSPLELGVDGVLTAFKVGSSEHVVSETKMSGNYMSYQTDLRYYLAEGPHTFTFKVTGIAPDRKSTLALLAETKFVPIAESELPTSVRIEAANYSEKPEKLGAGKGVEEGSADKKTGTIMKFSSQTADFGQEMSVKYPFNVYVAGTYNISKLVANNIADQWKSMSAYTLRIDGEDLELEDNKNIHARLDAEGNPDTEGKYSNLIRIYNTDLTRYLDIGQHELEFVITTQRYTDGAPNGAYAFFDYVDLELQEQPALVLECDSKYIAEGSDTYVSPYWETQRTGGKQTAKDDVVSYISSDNTVATVDAAGNVHAVGPGKAVITATAVWPGTKEEQVATVDIKVTRNDLYVETTGFTVDGQAAAELPEGVHTVNAKVEIVNNGWTDGTAALVLAAYAGNTLKGVAMVEDNAVPSLIMTGGTPTATPYELKLENIDMTGVTDLAVIVLNDKADLSPLAQKMSFAD